MKILETRAIPPLSKNILGKVLIQCVFSALTIGNSDDSFHKYVSDGILQMSIFV